MRLIAISSIFHELLMTIHHLGSCRHAQSGPSLGLALRATTAIRRYLPSDLSPFDPPEMIAWRRSPVGMALIQLVRFGESEHVHLMLDQHWQPLRNPEHAISAVLAEAELEYEALRPIEPRALVVQPRDASLGLPPGEEPRLERRVGYHDGAAAIDQIRNTLRLAANGSVIPDQGAIGSPPSKQACLEGAEISRRAGVTSG
jgi:hypothetical protein